MLFELGWSIYIAVIGGLILNRTTVGLPHAFMATFAFPAGLIVVSLVLGLIAIVVPTKVMGAGLLVSGALLLGILLLAEMRRAAAARGLQRSAVGIFWALLPVVAGWVLVNYFDTGFVIGDTSIQSVMAQGIIDFGWASPDVKSSLANWSFTYVFMQVLGALGDRVYFAMLQPVMGVTTISAFGLTLFYLLRQGSRPANIALAAAGAILLTAAVLLSCFYFAVVLTVLTSNFLLAGFSCLLVLAAFGSRDGLLTERGGAVLIAACLAGIGLSRIEGLVYLSFFALWLVSAQVLRGNQALVALTLAIVPAALVNIVLMIVGSGDLAQYSIVPPAAMIGIIAISLAWLPFVRFVAPRLPAGLLASGMTLVAIALAVLTGIMLLLSASLQESFSSLMANMFSDRLWGVVPLLLLGISPVLVGFGRDRLVSSGLALGFALGCVILLLALGRSPYYVDINDSGHRLLGSFALPMMLLMLAGCIRMFPTQRASDTAGQDDGHALAGAAGR